jgi:hypothetical protein
LQREQVNEHRRLGWVFVPQLEAFNHALPGHGQSIDPGKRQRRRHVQAVYQPKLVARHGRLDLHSAGREEGSIAKLVAIGAHLHSLNGLFVPNDKLASTKYGRACNDQRAEYISSAILGELQIGVLRSVQPQA